jgi:hypothetical protein
MTVRELQQHLRAPRFDPREARRILEGMPVEQARGGPFTDRQQAGEDEYTEDSQYP